VYTDRQFQRRGIRRDGNAIGHCHARFSRAGSSHVQRWPVWIRRIRLHSEDIHQRRLLDGGEHRTVPRRDRVGGEWGVHLQTTVGHAKPIAYALDGYALYGSLEPDGSALLLLDDYNGHTDSAGEHHYHGTTTYPYIDGGLRGRVTVSQGGIEPQPVTKPMRAPGDPLRGAVMTMFETIAAGSYRLTYTLNGHSYRVADQVTEKSVNFTFTDAAGNSRTETYKR